MYKINKMGILEAARQYGISRVRIYDLIERGIIKGYRSKLRGRGANSWVDSNSLETHINERDKRHAETAGRPISKSRDKNYVTVKEASEQIGYSPFYVRKLAKEGKIKSRKLKNNVVVHYPSLLAYKNRKQ